MSNPIRIEIVIECQEERDINTHLSVIRQQIKQKLKQEPENPVIEFQDSNNYGEHRVEINRYKL